MRQDIVQMLRSNAYPGRGILLGRSADGKSAAIAYFIMGRSENSRNRVFEETEDGIQTQPFDPAKVSDPSLIIYHPVRILEDGRFIVTNGDQTDTLAEVLSSGRCFRHALRQRTFEPDDPNWTPRISGLLMPDGSYMLSIIKTLDGDPACCCRYYFEYDNPLPGTAHFMSTYAGDGSPLPSFTGEPVYVGLPWNSAEALSEELWGAMNTDNRISLYTAMVNLESGSWSAVIRNANGTQNVVQMAGQAGKERSR